jgi:hypothetical protein
MSRLGIVLIVACLIADMATPLYPGAFRLDPAESIHGVGPRLDTELRPQLSAPSVPDQEATPAESFRFETLRWAVVSARPPLHRVLPRAALAPAGIDVCSSRGPEEG